MPEDVQFQRGLSTNIPSELVPGTFTVQTDTRTLHLDLESERIQIQDNTKLPLDGSVAMTGDLNLAGHLIKNLGAAIDATDAVNKQFLEEALNNATVFNYAPSDFNSITKDGIYIGDLISTGNYSPIPPGGYIYRLEILIHANRQDSTSVQLACFADSSLKQEMWFTRIKSASGWEEWVPSSGWPSIFMECPSDIFTIGLPGIYFDKTQTITQYTNLPENASKPIIIFATRTDNTQSVVKIEIGLFLMQDATYRWFIHPNAGASGVSWIEISGNGGSGGGGNLPEGGSPDTILIGTDTPGQGAWTSTMPAAVVIDDGEIN